MGSRTSRAKSYKPRCKTVQLFARGYLNDSQRAFRTRIFGQKWVRDVDSDHVRLVQLGGFRPRNYFACSTTTSSRKNNESCAQRV